MIDQQLLSEVFDKKIINVIKTLLSHEGDFFSIRELADKAGVTVSTTFRIVQSLERIRFVKKIQRGRIKFFQIQPASKAYKQFSELFVQKKTNTELINLKVKELYPDAKFETVSPKKDKNKIFIITEAEIDDSTLVKELNHSVDKKLKIMSIHPDQFQKMKAMGLI